MPALTRFGIRVVVLIAVVATLLFAIHLTNITPPTKWRAQIQQQQQPYRDGTDVNVDADAPPCRLLAGTEDVVVVMRTGATEIKDKLHVHLNTTFRCYSDVLIFSDYAEVFEGHQVYDALADVDQGLKETNGDFQHYQRLQQLGREGLSQDELHGESYESGPIGKNDNPGWRLDKYKFLPMVVQTLKLRPEAKWYVFVEPDTYVVWSNMVQWLLKLNPFEDSYYGSEVQIGPDVFAHGGSAFVMSKPAMRTVADFYLADPQEWHTRTSQHWAGDCILGTALKHAGVDLTWAWPMFQGGNPADLSWNEWKADRHLWCVPALSYHHFSPSEVESVWAWEQQRILATVEKENIRSWWQPKETILRHSDMFMQYVMPNLTSERTDWSNLSEDIIPNSQGLNIGACRAICEAKPECLQYALSTLGCSNADFPRMGHPAPGIQSGWMFERVDAWKDSLDHCPSGTGWVVT